MMEPSGPIDSRGLNIDIARAKEILVQFLHDSTTNAGFTEGILGISGGVDSAVSAYLCADALGKEHTLGVLMPYRTSSPKSLEDGLNVVNALGIRHEIVDISPMVDAYCEALKVKDSLRRGNIMARMRMIVLYDISARDNALVIGTSNKTELLVGYGTLFGDMASAINPIGDLYKTQVWMLAEALGIPKTIIQKKPTADLWEGQTDEDELGITYKELDRLLYAMIDDRRSDQELAEAGFQPERIASVRKKIQTSQFKRRPPVIAKLSSRTINVDFRYARDWGM
jgi:NAD+ synthase